jgi:hypothetical protein
VLAAEWGSFAGRVLAAEYCSSAAVRLKALVVLLPVEAVLAAGLGARTSCPLFSPSSLFSSHQPLTTSSGGGGANLCRVFTLQLIAENRNRLLEGENA